MESWQGPVILGGDFNLIRFASDKKTMLGLIIDGLMLLTNGCISGLCWNSMHPIENSLGPITKTIW